MTTTNVKKYELSMSDTQALETARAIITELSEEDFFLDYPFYDYSADECIDLINDILDKDGEQIG